MSTFSSKLLFSVLAWSASGALALPCSAQSSAAGADAGPLRTQYRKGLAELDKSNWQAAETIFADLLQKSPTYDVAGSLAAAETELGKYDRAARHLALALKSVPPKEKADTTAQLRAEFAEALKRVGTFRLSINASSAEIRADGEALGSYPDVSEIYLKPGKHTVEARADGGVASRDVQVTAGSSETLQLEVQSASAPSEPAATSAPGSVELPPSKPSNDSAEQGQNWIPTYVTGGLALVAIGVGTGFAIDTAKAKSDAEKKRAAAVQAFGADSPCGAGRGAGSPICQDLEGLQDRRKHSQTGATASFVIGGVFAAAAVGSYFLWAQPRSEGRASARMGAWFDGRGGSVLLEGSF